MIREHCTVVIKSRPFAAVCFLEQVYAILTNVSAAVRNLPISIISVWQYFHI